MKLRNVLSLVGLVALSHTMPTANAQTETILHSFSGTDGYQPVAALVQGNDGNSYGTTSGGGTNGYGTIFRIGSGGAYTTLYSFVGSPRDGRYPYAGLVQGSDGNFYGTTYEGGTSTNCYFGCGTVFRVSPSGIETTLYSFVGSPSDGIGPRAGLVQGSDGNFYGTTSGGGHNSGTVFRISPAGSYTNLYAFGSPSADGAAPWAGLILGSDGNFYGTTLSGGTYRVGTVFQISPSGTYTGLHSFGGGGSQGVYPDGQYPQGGLVQGDDGDFYGMTTVGGPGGQGAVFRISPTGAYANLRFFGSFDNGSGWFEDGSPSGGLIQGSDGNFYGTTYNGGTNQAGTVFRFNPVPIDGTTNYSYAVLCSFRSSRNDGATPQAGLVQGSDGNFYGTTAYGGTNSCCFEGFGTVFKLTVPLSPPANQISEIQFFNVLDSTIVALPIPSVAGETYQLQYSDSMSPTNWLNTGGTITSIGGPLVLIDIVEPLPPQRFYRAVITP